MQDYKQLIEKIAKAANLSFEEVDRKVEAKCAKLSGLISKEGSAQIVASELGISFEKEKMKVSELMSGMKKAGISGKIISMAPIRSFTTKKGVESKVLAMTLADDTGNIRTVLWDTNHIALFEDGKIKEGDVVEISNATVRNDELHLGSFGDIKLSTETFENVKTEITTHEKEVIDLKTGQNAKVRGFIVQVFEPKFFEVCPECKKKVMDNECPAHGAVTPSKRALISGVIDDGTESIRAVFFSDQIKQAGIEDKDLEEWAKKRDIFLGEEFFIEGNIRRNTYFNNDEMIVSRVEKINLDSLVNELKSS